MSKFDRDVDCNYHSDSDNDYLGDIMKLFIGNIALDVTEEELKQLFNKFGDVEQAKIVFDKFTHQSRNFGYVKMAEPESAISAIKKLNGKKYKGHKLQVNQARTHIRGRKGNNRRNGPPRYH
jgi:RNA recognition motif-containing protein